MTMQLLQPEREGPSGGGGGSGGRINRKRYIWRRGLKREAESSCFPAGGGGAGKRRGLSPPPADYTRVGGWENISEQLLGAGRLARSPPPRLVTGAVPNFLIYECALTSDRQVSWTWVPAGAPTSCCSLEIWGWTENMATIYWTVIILNYWASQGTSFTDMAPDWCTYNYTVATFTDNSFFSYTADEQISQYCIHIHKVFVISWSYSMLMRPERRGEGRYGRVQVTISR